MSVKVSVYERGHYCLMEDLVQGNVLDLIDGRNRGSPGKEGFVGVLDARDVDIDLQSHLATSSPFANTAGINIRPSARQVTIRNGTIRTPGPFGIGAWVVNHKPTIYASFAEEDRPPTYSVDSVKYAWDYQPPTHHILDKLTIQSGGRGVVLAGDSNTLRNSTVEVDSAVAAYIYGPNAVIEGNTFIVHTPADQYIPATSAILKLRDADNAVIRNNRFVFKGGLFSQDRAEAAINLLASRNVTIENNTVEGVKVLVRKDETTTVLDRDNLIK